MAPSRLQKIPSQYLLGKQAKPLRNNFVTHAHDMITRILGSSTDVVNNGPEVVADTDRNWHSFPFRGSSAYLIERRSTNHIMNN